MFPLETVLFPHQALPLHVFEERYRVLVRTCLAGDGEFGVTLIQRGSEVGGGDVRTDVGTVARILEARELHDGRWVLAAVGTRRVRVVRWLPDDPHPVADVEDLPELPATPRAAVMLDSVERQLRSLFALVREDRTRTTAGPSDDDGPGDLEPDFVLDGDPAVASYQVCALAPVGPLDAQSLLTRPGPDSRLELLGGLLGELLEVLRLGLQGW